MNLLLAKQNYNFLGGKSSELIKGPWGPEILLARYNYGLAITLPCLLQSPHSIRRHINISSILTNADSIN